MLDVVHSDSQIYRVMPHQWSIDGLGNLQLTRNDLYNRTNLLVASPHREPSGVGNASLL